MLNSYQVRANGHNHNVNAIQSARQHLQVVPRLTASVSYATSERASTRVSCVGPTAAVSLTPVTRRRTTGPLLTSYEFAKTSQCVAVAGECWSDYVAERLHWTVVSYRGPARYERRVMRTTSRRVKLAAAAVVGLVLGYLCVVTVPVSRIPVGRACDPGRWEGRRLQPPGALSTYTSTQVGEAGDERGCRCLVQGGG